jgi:hypothetical protein
MEPEALGYAEEAIRAVGRGDAPFARTAVAQAFEVDHKLSGLADIIYLACSEIEADGRVTTATWNTLADAVGPGRLLAVVEGSRTS